MSADILRKRLDEGEKLLWYGTMLYGGKENKAPEPLAKYIYGKIMKALIIPDILATVAVIALFGRKAFIILPIWILQGILMLLYLRPEEWVYGISDKRVFVGTERSGMEIYSLSDIEDTEVSVGTNGLGCVKFTAKGNACGFYGLKEPQKVYEILTGAMPKDKFLE